MVAEALVTLKVLDLDRPQAEFVFDTLVLPIEDITQRIDDFKQRVWHVAQQYCWQKNGYLRLYKTCWLRNMGVECNRDRRLDFFCMGRDAKVCFSFTALAAIPAGGRQIFAKTTSGQCATLGISPSDTVTSLRKMIWGELGAPPEEQRLIYAGRQLEDDYTLDKIHTCATILVAYRLRGGGAAEASFADVSNSSALSKCQWSDNAPKWRMASPGLCVEGVCKNDRCEARDKMVICNMRFAHFDLILDLASETCKCPLCEQAFIPITCAFNKCKWWFDGIKLEGGRPVKAQSMEWNEAGDQYERFSDASSNQVTWVRLLLVARPAATSTMPECSICYERIPAASGVQTPSPPCPRPHHFHKECISSWLRLRNTCPMCRAVVGDVSKCTALPQPVSGGGGRKE